jgi:hypothetical protein
MQFRALNVVGRCVWPAIFLQSRSELGDASRGEVVSINNYYRLFKDILTPVQPDGLRLFLTPFSQEEFNPTDDRKGFGNQ